jgi:cell envelope opacity-associated protein A
LDGNADYTLVDVSYPYAVPAAHTFIVRLASQYRAACGEQMVVTSAVRPTTMRLANSVDKSVHPTGMAIDLRKPRNAKCLTWLRNTLIALDATGVLEAVEERSPPHFHVAIFPQQYQQYVSARPGPKVPPTPQLAQASTSVADARRYEVRRGDSLWTIARQNSLSVEELQRVNNLRTSRILAGQVLLIPSGR